MLVRSLALANLGVCIGRLGGGGGGHVMCLCIELFWMGVLFWQACALNSMNHV